MAIGFEFDQVAGVITSGGTQIAPGVTLAAAPITDGAVGHYRFDGSLANIGSAGSANLTVEAGTEQYLPGPYPSTQAVLLDGATVLKTVGAVAALELVVALTIDFMAYAFGGNDGSSSLVTYRDTGATGYAYLLELAAAGQGLNRPNLAWTAAAAEVARVNNNEVSLPKGRWVHVAITRPTAATSAKFFVDGKPIVRATGLAAGAAWADVTPALYVGGFSSTDTFAGLMADLRIFDSEKTEAAILTLAKASNPQAFLGQL